MSVSDTTKVSSYPPALRPTNLPDTPVDHTDDLPDQLPTIDLSNLDVEKLQQVCGEWGIFRLINHGVPECLMDRLREAIKELFDLDFETKQALLKGPFYPEYTWGKGAIRQPGVELPKDVPEIGMENLTVKGGRLQICTGALQQQQPHVSILNFRYLLEEYYEHMIRVAMSLYETMRSSLNIYENEGDSNKFIDEPSCVLRFFRYLPSSTTQIKGLDAHTDSTLLTILFQDDTNGLQFLRDGVWLPVKPLPNTLIVNLGDLLQVMSDDKYKSSPHRVVLDTHRERISVGCFVFPEENSVIAGSNGKYRPFSVKEFMRQIQDDVVTCGNKVGLSRFLAN